MPLDPATGMIIASAVSGGLSYFGGSSANAAASREAGRNRDFQKRMAKNQQDWEKMMSDTAHQREIRDLRAAGLNPILSGTGGMGASTPSVGLPAGNVAPVQDVVTPALNSAIAAYNAGIDAQLKKSTEYKQGVESARIIEDTQKIREEKLNAIAERDKIIADTATSKALAGKHTAEAGRVPQDIATSRALEVKHSEEAKTQNEVRQQLRSLSRQQSAMADLLKTQNVSEKTRNLILGEDYQVAAAAARRAKTEGEIDDTVYGKVLRYIDRASQLIPFLRQPKK